MEFFIQSIVKLLLGIGFLIISLFFMKSILTAIWNFNDFIDNSLVVEANITNIDFSREKCLDPGESEKSGTFQGPFPCMRFYNVKYEFSPFQNQKYYGSMELDESELEKLPKQNLPYTSYVEFLSNKPEVNKIYGTNPKTIFQLIFSPNSSANLIDIAFFSIFLFSGTLLIRNVWKTRYSLKVFRKSTDT